MPVRFLVLALLFVGACDSSGTSDGDPVDPSVPSGRFEIEPIWFRLTRVADPSVGGVEDLQAWISGSITVSVADGALTGSGSCTLRRRLHRAWIPETTDETNTLPFTAAGSLGDGAVTVTLQGCAWAMTRYTGSFKDGVYTLRLGDIQTAPAWDPDVWSSATQLDGDDPKDLVLARG